MQISFLRGKQPMVSEEFPQGTKKSFFSFSKEKKIESEERKWKHEERKKTVLVSHHSFIMRLSSFDFSQISIMFCLLFFSLFSLGSIDPTVQEMSCHHCTGNKVTRSYNMLLFFQKKKEENRSMGYQSFILRLSSFGFLPVDIMFCLFVFFSYKYHKKPKLDNRRMKDW